MGVITIKLAKSPLSRVPSCRGMFSQGHVSKQSDMLATTCIRMIIVALPNYTWWLILVSN